MIKSFIQTVILIIVIASITFYMKNIYHQKYLENKNKYKTMCTLYSWHHDGKYTREVIFTNDDTNNKFIIAHNDIRYNLDSFSKIKCKELTNNEKGKK